MVVRRRKKHRRFRGRRTYHGSHKKWRGGGSRGGRGKAGLHKHKWSYTVKYEPEHFGKKGFRSLRKKGRGINLCELERMAKKSGENVIDVVKLGYEKVLGFGKITVPVKVMAKKFTRKAREKIENAGGEVVVVE